MTLKKKQFSDDEMWEKTSAEFDKLEAEQDKKSKINK
jgi:hypothetical protein